MKGLIMIKAYKNLDPMTKMFAKACAAHVAIIAVVCIAAVVHGRNANNR